MNVKRVLLLWLLEAIVFVLLLSASFFYPRKLPKKFEPENAWRCFVYTDSFGGEKVCSTNTGDTWRVSYGEPDGLLPPQTRRKIKRLQRLHPEDFPFVQDPVKHDQMWFAESFCVFFKNAKGECIWLPTLKEAMKKAHEFPLGATSSEVYETFGDTYGPFFPEVRNPTNENLYFFNNRIWFGPRSRRIE